MRAAARATPDRPHRARGGLPRRRPSRSGRRPRPSTATPHRSRRRSRPAVRRSGGRDRWCSPPSTQTLVLRGAGGTGWRAGGLGAGVCSDGRRGRHADLPRIRVHWLALGMASFAVTDLRRKFARFVLDWSPFMAVLLVYDRLRGYADGLLVHAARGAADQGRGRAFPEADPDGLAAVAPVARRERPALVGLRDVVRLPDALRRDALRRGRSLDVGAPSLRPLRDHGVRPRADGLCDLRSLSGCPAVDGRAARLDRRGPANGEDRLAPRPRRARTATSSKAASTTRTTSRRCRHCMRPTHSSWCSSSGVSRRGGCGRSWRCIAPAMAFSLVYSGEHYVVDCIAGWAYAAFAYLSVEYVFARRDARRAYLEPAMVD